MKNTTIRNRALHLASVAALATLFGIDVALGQTYIELNTGSSVPWNTTLWTGGAGGVPPQTSTQVGLFRSGGTVTISDTSTSTTPGGLLIGWNTGNFTMNVTSGTLTVSTPTLAEGTGQGTLTLGESGSRTGTLNQSGGLVITQYVRANGGTGVYNLNSGTLQTPRIARASAAAGSMTVNFGGGTLQATGTSSTGLTGSSGISMVVNAGGGTVNNGGFAAIMNAPISGTGNLTLTGGGTTTYTADNTHSGTTTLSAGTLRIGNSGTTGNLTGSLVNNATVIFDRSDNATYAGVISGSGTVTKQGAGTLVLGAGNTYTGLTTVAAGVLQSGNSSAAGIVGGSYDVAAGAKLAFSRNGDTVRFLTQSISGAGDLEFQAQSAGFYTFQGTYTGTLSYTGQTIVNLTTSTSALWYQNALWLEKDNVLPGATVVNLQSGKIYNRNQTGTGISVAGLTGSASTFITTDRDSLNVQKWTVTVASGSSFTYAGVIGADGTGTGNNNLSFTKAGAGTQILTGSNSYTGGTTITGGTLQIGAGGTAGQIAGDVTANGAFVFDRSNDLTYAGVISGSTGTVTKRNANTLTLSAGSMPFTGSVTVSSGSLRFTGTANTVTVSSLITGSGALVRDAAASASSSFLILNGSNNYSGGTTINAGFVQLGTNNAIGTGPLTFTATTDRGSLNLQGFNQTVAGLTASNTTQFRGDIYNNQANALSTLTIDTPSGQTFTYANQIGALVGWSKIALVKSGSGTQILSGNNLFTGNTTITGGTLQIGAGGATGSIPGNAAVSSGATLAFNRSDAVTFSGTLSGSGALRQIGSGTLTLTGNNTLTGTTTISAGALAIGSGGTAGSIAGNVVNNAALLFNRSDALTYAGLISGNGSVTQQGAGTLTLTGSNSYSGSTEILAGTLAMNGSVASAVNVANAAILGGAGTINGLVTVAGGGILAPGNSPGTLTMTSGLSLADSSILNFELVATDTTVGGGINDLIVVTGNFLLDGVLNVAGTGDFSTVADNTKWRLFNYSGGTFTNAVLTLGTMPSVGASGKYFEIDTATAGQVNLVIVPEPGALALAGLGIAAAAWVRSRRRARAGRKV